MKWNEYKQIKFQHQTNNKEKPFSITALIDIKSDIFQHTWWNFGRDQAKACKEKKYLFY